MVNIKDLNLTELESVISVWGFPRFHAKQIFTWMYQRGVQDFGLMSDLPSSLRDKLESHYLAHALDIREKRLSADGTEKFLFALQDKGLIEAVSIPTQDRVTGCISSQVGCKFNCGFCASAKSGFSRDLSAGEIIEQALVLKFNSKAKKLSHLVFMGTGEPLDNYDNVLKAIRVINSKESLNIGARRITVSTSGLIPQIKRLSEEGIQIELSVSLHASDNKTRSALMPVNKKYPLEELITACKAYYKETGRQVTFEYILISKLNSSLADAKKLGTILHGFDSKVNLIPLNSAGMPGFEAPGKKDVMLFKDALTKCGIHATVRQPRGQDIEAACGQLRAGCKKS
jgi:23S rRNA (adenine2503-C2)-methyltransferase